MKRTTYIILGVIFAVIFVHMIAIYTLLDEYATVEKITFTERNQKEFVNIKVIYLDMEHEGGLYNFSGKINVSPVTEQETCRFDYPQKLADHIHFENAGDTLYIRMDINDYFSHIERVRKGRFYMDELFFDLQVDSVITYLSSESSNAKWNLSHISVDSLHIKTDKKLEMNSCTIDKFSFTGQGVKADHVMIAEMYLDLDERQTFELKGGEIDRLFCTGNRKSTIKNSGIIRQLAWTPKEEDATLHIELKASTEMFLSN